MKPHFEDTMIQLIYIFDAVSETLQSSNEHRPSNLKRRSVDRFPMHIRTEKLTPQKDRQKSEKRKTGIMSYQNVDLINFSFAEGS